MSNALLSSKTIIVEEDPSIRSVPALITAVVAMPAICERGTTRTPVLSTSYEEWGNEYGGFISNGNGALAARGFYDAGGQYLWTSRVEHYSDITDNTTNLGVQASVTLNTAAGSPTSGSVLGTEVETFSFVDTDTIKVTVNGVGPTTSTFNCAPASVTGSNTAPFALTDGWEMTFVTQDGTQTITFDAAEFVAIGAATAEEVAAVINAEAVGIQATVSAGAVVITTDQQGTGASIGTFADVTGTPVATLGFTGASDTGTGDAVDSTAVTVAELKTMIENDISGLTVNDVSGAVQIVTNLPGPTGSIQVDATSTMDDELGLDNATHAGTDGSPVATLLVEGKTNGSYANDLTIRIAASTSGDTDAFDLTVLDAGLIVETWPNLKIGSVDVSDADYCETVINDEITGSNLIVVTDQLAAPASPDNLPATGDSTPTGGDDGLTGIATTDFIGDSAGATGLRAFDETLGLTLLISPDDATTAMHNAMLTYCESTRDKSMFAILDPPEGLDTSGIVSHVDVGGLYNSSEFGALYWPRPKILNPSTLVFGNDAHVVVPPSGIIAGVYARTDNSRPGGIYLPPAGVEYGRLTGVVGFENDEMNDEAKRDLVYPKRINPLRLVNGSPTIDGVRTLKGNGNFPTVAERRGASFIEQSVKAALEFARLQNNTEKLRASVERTVTSFLIDQMRVGAFRTNDPATAFFVDFGDGLNPPSVMFAGQLVGRIGLATNKPAEFIVLKFTQDTRAFEESIA